MSWRHEWLLTLPTYLGTVLGTLRVCKTNLKAEACSGIAMAESRIWDLESGMRDAGR